MTINLPSNKVSDLIAALQQLDPDTRIDITQVREDITGERYNQRRKLKLRRDGSYDD